MELDIKVIILHFILFFRHTILQIFKKMAEKKKQSSESLGSGKKSTTIQRQFFVCYSLYLHTKKKHDQNISMKCLKNTKHQWSGNVKNIYFEFVQENSDKELSNQNQKNKKKQISQFTKRNTKVEAKRLVPEYSNNLCQVLQRRIQRAFNQFQVHQQKLENIQTVQAFIRFVQQRLSLSDLQSLGEDLMDQSLDFMLQLMNDFMHSIGDLAQEDKKNKIKSLAMFSDWLYQNKYTKRLAIQQEKYEQFFDKRSKQLEYIF